MAGYWHWETVNTASRPVPSLTHLLQLQKADFGRVTRGRFCHLGRDHARDVCIHDTSARSRVAQRVSLRSLRADPCIDLDLDQPFRIDETHHLHDGACRANRAEHLSV